MIPRIAIFFLATVFTFAREATSVDKPFNEVRVGGKYRMVLTTGDELIGTVELKDDTSLVVETNRGPFTFRGALIREYEMLQPPPPPAPGNRKDIHESTILTYGQLLARGPTDQKIEIRIKSGSVFVGKVAEINKENLNLDVEGSLIPIGENVIARISTVPDKEADPAKEKAAEKDTSQGPFDTIYVVNPKTDEYGSPLDPLMFVGKIRQYDDEGLTVTTPTGVTRAFKRKRLYRVIRHTSRDYESEIQRYAKPLFCPEGMILVDLPPGKEGRPFFKVCIDKYEYPNQKGLMPKGNVTYQEAKKNCEAAGKRLCTSTEWRWACSGLEGYTYPYGWHFEENKCNTHGARELETAGLRRHCRGKFGVYDMVGNIFEWVVGPDGSPALMGGPYSKCQTVSPGVGGAAKPQTGFRCCKSN
ncbi:MAG: SUMF1/EgtB/PvdO family nonheme iron enzyme [Chitinivibrionales bacterium]|nr:SUMF1/EgtB/PvdO family nonheme iron enzyme [Chitinivibrionales bacterium]MBD3356274.1 SUMF1/EgtB/PvdO family nonheme iron enzyme [Chitinivibrionales bacterium]